MKGLKKLAVSAACGLMLLALGGCGSKGKGAAPENTYSMWLYSAQDSSYYTEYIENPALKYVLGKTWGEEEKKIALDFLIPPAGSENNNYQTMVASGDYPDVLMAVISDSAPTMYEKGLILDITDYVEKYMPNYSAILKENEDVRGKAVYEIDGAERVLSITVATEGYEYYFSGPQYRRDWLVKYGTNPQTGAAFTGGYTDPADVDSWEDDVVFPSGGTDPVYISDWEWMFGIFTKAQEALGIKDSYSLSIYYPGFTWSGGFCSCFGGGVPMWYKNTEGKVSFGGDEDQMRAYLQCLNTWYNNGWLDKEFNERTSDMFYAIDDTSVRQGKVGMWFGMQGQLGGRMDLHDGGFTEGMYSAGCAWPINDVYGTESCKYVVPGAVTSTSLAGTSYYVMSKAEGKDLATLCSFFDYFYSEEGALLHTLGLSAEQVAETDDRLYKEWGMENGAFTIGEDGRYLMCDTLKNDGGSLATACSLSKLPGLTLVDSVDRGYNENYENSLKSWIKFKNTAFFMGTNVTDNIPNEVAREADGGASKVLEYMTVHAPEFIKGIKDPFNDDDWNVWCTMLKKFNYKKVSDMFQPYVDKYTF